MWSNRHFCFRCYQWHRAGHVCGSSTFSGRESATANRLRRAVDLRLAAGFRRTVLRRLVDIGYRHTATYATVALLAGSPKAVRAVGTACATNPLPIVVPCHRVVRSDGDCGQLVNH